MKATDRLILAGLKTVCTDYYRRVVVVLADADVPTKDPIGAAWAPDEQLDLASLLLDISTALTRRLNEPTAAIEGQPTQVEGEVE